MRRADLEVFSLFTNIILPLISFLPLNPNSQSLSHSLLNYPIFQLKSYQFHPISLNSQQIPLPCLRQPISHSVSAACVPPQALPAPRGEGHEARDFCQSCLCHSLREKFCAAPNCSTSFTVFDFYALYA